MRTLWILLSTYSAVSALVLNPNLLRLPSSNTTPDNGTTGLQLVQGPWHTSNVLDAPQPNLNTTYSSTLKVNRQFQYVCTDYLGQGRYMESCVDAARNLAFIPPGSARTQVMWWGRRGLPVPGHVPLPQEVVSSDGHCRINLHLIEGGSANFARASQSQVQAGVATVITNCMRNRPRPQGGTVININDDGLLRVWVSIDKIPPAVTCHGRMRPAAESSCKWILDQMRADDYDPKVFGFRQDPNVEVPLPWRFESPDRRCALTVKTAGLSDLSSWGMLWEAAVELSGICARQGLQGRYIRLGEDSHLAMFLDDPSTNDIDSL